MPISVEDQCCPTRHVLVCRLTPEVLENRKKRQEEFEVKKRKVVEHNPGRRPDWSPERLQEVSTSLGWFRPHLSIARLHSSHLLCKVNAGSLTPDASHADGRVLFERGQALHHVG